MRIKREIQMGASGGGQSIRASGIAARTGRTQTCNRHDSPKPKTPLTRGGRPHNFPPAESLSHRGPADAVGQSRGCGALGRTFAEAGMKVVLANHRAFRAGHRPPTLLLDPMRLQHCISDGPQCRNTASAPLIQARRPDPASSITISWRLDGFRRPPHRDQIAIGRGILPASASRGFLPGRFRTTAQCLSHCRDRPSSETLVWTAPASQGLVAAGDGSGRLRSCVRPWCAAMSTAGPDGLRGSDPKHHGGVYAPKGFPGCSDPRFDRSPSCCCPCKRQVRIR
jgi:hypothetical protein